MDGSANPHDILAIRGIKELAKYLVTKSRKYTVSRVSR